MRATVIHGPRDVRFEEWPEPKRSSNRQDAIIRIAAACVCGSDLWPYRGLQPLNGATPMGHEYCGIVVDVGGDVRDVKPGQFVVGSFAASDNTCPTASYGYQSSCEHREFCRGAQAPLFRVPLADGTLVPTPDVPSTTHDPEPVDALRRAGTGGLPPMPQRGRAPPSSSSATALSGFSACSPPGRWARSASSR